MIIRFSQNVRTRHINYCNNELNIIQINYFTIIIRFCYKMLAKFLQFVPDFFVVIM